MTTFKPGDRVRLTEEHPSSLFAGPPVGAHGVILSVNLDARPAVSFADWNGGHGAGGSEWFVPANKLALVEPEAEEPAGKSYIGNTSSLFIRPGGAPSMQSAPPPDHAADLKAIRDEVREARGNINLPDMMRLHLDRIFDLTLPAECRSREERS